MRWSWSIVLACGALAACSSDARPGSSIDGSMSSGDAGGQDQAPLDSGGGGQDLGHDGGQDSTPADAFVGACPAVDVPTAELVSCTQPVLTAGYDQTVTVTGWGTGFEGCLAPYATFPGYDALASSAHLLRVLPTGGAEQAFGLIIQGVSPTITIGDTIRVVHESRGGGFGPTIGRLEITRGTDLVLYVGVGGRPEQMTAPAGVTFALGGALCSDEDCGPWGRFQLTVSAQGGSANLAPGASARVGPYSVTVGQSEQQTGNSSTCADWFVSRTTVAIVP